MLTLPGQARIFFKLEPIDMRKSFEGLMTAVQETFKEEAVTSGAYFVFLNKLRNRMKVLYWDRDGLAIWYKRLEKGHFTPGQLNKNSLDRREFLMLLEGITPKRLQVRFTLS